MRIKRTYAATMREALAMVKQEQGPDAVILGNKKVPGGVEILSAVDFDHRSVDAYAGTPDRSVSRPAPAARPANTPGQPAASLDLQSVPDFVLHQSVEQPAEPEGQRKEPVLGLPDTAWPEPAPVDRPAVSVQPIGSRPPKQVEPQPRTQAPTQTKTQASRPHKSAAEPAAATGAQSKAATKKEAPRKKKEFDQTEQELRRKMLPVEEEARLRAVERDENDLDEDVQRRFSGGLYPSGINPMMEEVKGEIKNLRDLMQSQLSVLDWDRYSDLHPVRTVLLNLMTELGLGNDVCEMIFNQLGNLSDPPQKVWQQALGLLAKSIPIADSDILSHGGRVALVGSTGVGKTTTIAKLAARFAHSHGKRSVAMITTDNFRIGAQEQLQHFARMLEIPLLTANSSEELTDRLTMLADKQLVLIDTAGMSQSDVRLSEQFHKLQHGSPEIKPYLVLSANTQLAALNETIRSFGKVKLAGAIVTKLDESASLGGIITTSIRHRLPLTYCGTGQRVPEDLQPAKTHRLVSKAVSLMQQFGEQIDKETMAFRYHHIISTH